jgi:hypothetical protein
MVPDQQEGPCSVVAMARQQWAAGCPTQRALERKIEAARDRGRRPGFVSKRGYRRANAGVSGIEWPRSGGHAPVRSHPRAEAH